MSSVAQGRNLKLWPDGDCPRRGNAQSHFLCGLRYRASAKYRRHRLRSFIECRLALGRREISPNLFDPSKERFAPFRIFVPLVGKVFVWLYGVGDPPSAVTILDVSSLSPICFNLLDNPSQSFVDIRLVLVSASRECRDND